MAFKNYRDESRKYWGTNEEKLNLDQIQTGCLLRIADASELMAKNYDQLQRDLNFYKNRYQEHREEIQRLANSNRSLRGVITKLKNKARK